jgi:hypothetical protein
MTDEELMAAVADARKRGIYTDDPAWHPIDEALTARGFDVYW